MEIKIVKHQPLPHRKAVLVDNLLYFMQDGQCQYMNSEMKIYQSLYTDLSEVISENSEAVPVYAGDTLEIRV